MRFQSQLSIPRLGRALLLKLSVPAVLLVLGVIAFAHVSGRTAAGPVYTVAALRAHLEEDQATWVDRPLRVRAIARACAAYLRSVPSGPCQNWLPVLTDPAAADGTEPLPLPLAHGPVPPLVALLRRLPFVGQVAPAPQRPLWDALKVHHIQLHAVPSGPPCQLGCYEALLLEATPEVP